jgi:8-oxo-dGTP pyrophosphatase MutT (NUDIX family)
VSDRTAEPPWLPSLAAAAQAVDLRRLTRAAPPDVTTRPSAVLIALRDAPDGPSVLLIERASTMRTHAGQVAFPGGGVDPHDASPAATALREAQEEVGLVPASVTVVATLPPLFLPPSGFVVTPVLAWWARPHSVGVVDAKEVASVHVVPIAELADPQHRFTVRHPSGYEGPGFATGGLFVWGFTAGLLDALLDLGGWTRAWDMTRRRPLPPVLGGDTATLGTVRP